MKFLPVLFLMPFVNGESSQCSKLAAKAAFQDRSTIVETIMKTLSGTWLSEGCETRPGPEYVLRHYSFQEDGKYKLIQHHYWDDSCSSPKLTIISIGHLKTRRDSLLNHDALGGYIKPSNITIIPQDIRAAKELDVVVPSHCPGQYWKSWRRYEEHVVYTNVKNSTYKLHVHNQRFEYLPESIQNHHDRNTQHYLHNSSGAMACLGTLKWAFEELRLIKVQLRPNSLITRGISEVHWELLLGDIPSRLNLREYYSPTGFQIPLVKPTKGETTIFRDKKYLVKYSCNICTNLMASERVPPHLIEKPRLPPYIWGEWVSERCEVRPLGLYLTRKFSFYNENSMWVGEHKLYSDPFCTLLKFVITAVGSFELGEPNEALKEASNVDFRIEQATLTIFNKKMLDDLPLGRCGDNEWELGVSQELSSTSGCPQLGIVIPSIQYDIVKVEMNYQGSWLLFLGQADTENLPRMKSERPTAFQVPLVKCADERLGHFISDPFSERFSNNGCQPVFSINWWMVLLSFSVLTNGLFL